MNNICPWSFRVTPPSPISHSDYAHVPVTPEKLEHDLQLELTADVSELKSRSWYHGNISRQKAERLVVNNGEYLVRDCISQPGDFVLTCVWKGVPLHFVVNSKISEEKSGPPKVWYRFEEEEFTSVQALIIFYLNHAKPITRTSGTVITNPIARCLPLSYYDIKYGALAGLAARLGHGTYTPTQSPKPSPFVTPTSSPSNSPVITRRSLTIRTGSQPLLSVEEDGPLKHIDRCDSLPAIGITMPNGETSNINDSNLPGQHHHSGSEPLLTPTNKSLSFSNLSLPTVKLTPATSDGHIGRHAPPKPSRIPSIKYKNRPLVVVRNRQLYEDDGTDYSDYDQAKSEPSWLKRMQSTPVAQDNIPTRDTSLKSSDSENLYDNNINKMPVHGVYDNANVTNGKEPSSRLRLFSDTRFSIIDTYEEVTPSPKEHAIDGDSTDSFPFIDEDIKNKNFSLPKEEANILLNMFAADLLPTDNKPLEPSTMISIRTLLLECNTKKLALHVTKVDVDFLSSIEEKDLGMGVNSGLELITLPQGKQLRRDVIER